LEYITSFSPDWVISLVSAVGWEEEKSFLSSLKENNPNVKIGIIGDIALFEPDICFKVSSIDAIIQNFTSDNISEFLSQVTPSSLYSGIIYRKGDELVRGAMSEQKEFSYPVPQHSLFPLHKYSLPYSRYSPITTVITSTYGCMYKCTFCPSGQIGFGYRNLDNTLEELDYIQKLGIKEIYFRDFSLSAPPSRLIELCRQMIKRDYSFRWSCDAVVSNMNFELLSLMKKAGCYLIFFGIESGQEHELKKVHKPIKDLNSIRQVFNECKKVGIDTLASFILGLPYQTEDDLLETLSFSKEISPTYASFNVFVPRYGTPLRNQLQKEGKMFIETDIDSSEKAFNLTSVSDERLNEIHRRAIREFYMRPSYIWDRFRHVNSFMQLKYLVKNGYSLFQKII